MVLSIIQPKYTLSQPVLEGLRIYHRYSMMMMCQAKMIFLNILCITKNFEKLWHHGISHAFQEKYPEMSICHQLTLEEQ